MAVNLCQATRICKREYVTVYQYTCIYCQSRMVWASIQICCRASECLYEFTKVSCFVSRNKTQQYKQINFVFNQIPFNSTV